MCTETRSDGEYTLGLGIGLDLPTADHCPLQFTFDAAMASEENLQSTLIS